VAPPSKEHVGEFLPPYKPRYPIDPMSGPVSKAMHVSPSLIGPEQRKVLDAAMKRAKDDVIPGAWKRWGDVTGRRYPAFIDGKRLEDADCVLVTMGAYSKDVEYVVDRLRKRNVRIGSLRMRYLRPFPTEEVQAALENARAVGVVDFSFSLGSPNHGSVLYNEMKAALYDTGSRPTIMDFIFAGGREMTIADLDKAVDLLLKAADEGRTDKPVRWLNLRGEDK
jgi:pyruvate ferredoxin oxidoreductase alpha subunit